MRLLGLKLLEMATVGAFTTIAAVLVFAMSASAQTTVLSGEGTPVLAIPPAAEDGGPRRWQVAEGDPLQLYEAPSNSAKTIDTLSADDLLRNFGCLEAGEIRTRGPGNAGNGS